MVSVILLNVIMLNVVMLNDMLNVVKFIVVMLNVVAPNVNHACIIMQETGNIFSDDESETRKRF